MTTSVKVHVNGRYRATVLHSTPHGSETTVVEGNYEGSPNPGGERTFWFKHDLPNTFHITEEYIPDEPKS